MTTIHLIVLGVQVNYDTCNAILSFSMRNMSRMVNYVDINHDIELSYGIHLRYGFSKKNDPFSGIFVNINDQCSFWSLHFLSNLKEQYFFCSFWWLSIKHNLFNKISLFCNIFVTYFMLSFMRYLLSRFMLVYSFISHLSSL